ncbi:MAG: L,D-transpeptidase family protein, partial [Chloroflexi bacterium]|nr:L,D-transpeptidase family protein [Chloroflexota bacterium]
TSIAWDVGVPYWRIAEANPGINTDGLDVGNTLTIPAKTDLLPLPVVEGKRMLVDISDQRAWAYQDGDLWREFIISTGIDRSPTQPGVFQMQLFDEYAYAGNWDLYMPDFIGIYEAWPGFMNGFHGLPTLSSGVTLWADVLGQPASYGCIILDLDDSTALWQWAEPGIVVEIRE